MSLGELKKIYNSDFFAEWGKTNRKYISSAEVISNFLFEQFRPRRMMDLGCGCGVYSSLFGELGVDVVSIDGVMPPHPYAFDVDIHLRDITKPIENNWGDFDLCLCFDVGEHIFEKDSDAFLKNATLFADRLLLSCAPKGQGGLHHVNEQPKRYWIKRLAEHGFGYNRKRTGIICEAFKILRPRLMWMGEHISVYERMLPPCDKVFVAKHVARLKCARNCRNPLVGQRSVGVS
jgi:SAM-dependent methyltransferase